MWKPHKNWAWVSTPRGFTVPFSVAANLPMPVAGVETDWGGVRGAVVNEETALKPVPSALVEKIWKS